MKVIGLCGASGSGKGTVVGLFLKHGFVSIDTDAVYHKLTSKDSSCLRELAARFGDKIINSNGALDRRVLSSIVFEGEGAKERHQALNKIAHKHVLCAVRNEISDLEKQGKLAVLVDAPMLYESGFDKECDLVVAVIADKELRISRIMARDSIARSAAEARLSAQLSDEYLIENSDYNIVNNGDLDSLARRVCEVADLILNK